MQRTSAIGLGLIVALGLGLAVVLGRSPSQRTPAPLASSSVKASASVIPSASAAPAASVSAQAPSDRDADADDSGSESFDVLPDGRKVPELPANAPKQVGFGVVVVAYRGAQMAAPDARSKEEAKARATLLIAEAKRDFTAAVAQGDRGSTKDAGRVPRDVLEPAPEYVLFTLTKGEVSGEAIDTPRGYWIVRRND